MVLPAAGPAVSPAPREDARPEGGDTPHPRAERRRGGLTGGVVPYVFMAGAVLYLLFFMVLPLGRGVLMSFTDTVLLNPTGGSWVGLDNYAELLGSDRFYGSLGATLVYAGVTVVASLVLGTAAALSINRAFRGRAVVRALLTLPWAVPTVAAVLIFSWIFNNQGGVLNRFMRLVGRPEQGWLLEPEFGMFSVLLTTTWKVFPFVMLVVLASLQSIPEELYEATRIDGADGLSTFRAVVLPHLLPTLRVVGLLMSIWSIRRFEIIYLLTGGGPLNSTNTLVVNVYREAFSNQQLGTAAAIGVLGMVIALLVTLAYFALERRQAGQEAG